MTVRLLTGDCCALLPTLDAESVQCVVTSPPYWGLRDYGHEGQLGLERTPDEYVAKMVDVFRAVRRVLREDGTLWLNLGDSYANDGKWGGHTGGKHAKALHCSPIGRNKRYTGLKPKDLCMIPARVALALQDDGWWIRSDIVWSKPNPMPESVTDRPTKAHEYLFLLAKAERYFYDAEAIKEPATWQRDNNPEWQIQRSITNIRKGAGNRNALDGGFTEWKPEDGRNKRSVWTVATQPCSGAHFATFPPKLIEPCVLAGSRTGDTVLDPFGGAGTTGLVADRLGRDAVLIELNPAYTTLAAERIAADSPLFAEAQRG